MKQLLVFCTAFLCTSMLLFGQVWEKVEGTNPYINRIFSPNGEPNRIIVSSDGNETDILQDAISFPIIGSGCQESIDSGKSFTNYFLTGYPVYDIYASKIQPNKWMAAVRSFNRGGILHSQDYGQTWNDFLSCDGVSQIWRISSTLKGESEFFVAGAISTNEGFLYSSDGLSTCQTSSGLSVEARAIAYSKIKPELLFIAGDSYSQGRVLRSYNNGQSWQSEVSGLEGLRILSLLPSSLDPAFVLCGADSLTINRSSIGKGIYMSQDTGRTWRRVGGEGAQVFDIVEHPRFPQYVAAAAGLQGVLVSSVGGRWFEHYNSGLPEGKSVRNVLIPDWEPTDEGCVTFAGVFGEGLYKSQPITSDVIEHQANNSVAFVSISPQPATDFVHFVWSNSHAQTGSIRIFDAFAREIYSVENAFFHEGQNTFNFNAAELKLPSAVYFIEISLSNARIFSKFIVL